MGKKNKDKILGAYMSTEIERITSGSARLAEGQQSLKKEKNAEKAGQGRQEETSQIIFELEGMSCASCAMRIEKGLRKVSGVKEANVNFATEQAAVNYDPAETNIEQ